MTNKTPIIFNDCEFRLDGGAMFGIVPRLFWERVAPPDELNRVRLAMNCVVLEADGERILIETGIGEKWSEKERAIYGITERPAFSDVLKTATGFGVEDISIVVNTHLHFDHAGGNTVADNSGEAVPQFPNARYIVSRREFEHAENPHPRDRASYRPADWRPLIQSGQLELIADEAEIIPGLVLTTIRGHSDTMQTWQYSCDDGFYYGFADLVPTTAHLSPAWIMSYDLFPLDIVEAKSMLLRKADEENWKCVFYHDPNVPLAHVTSIGGRFGISALMTYNHG